MARWRNRELSSCQPLYYLTHAGNQGWCARVPWCHHVAALGPPRDLARPPPHEDQMKTPYG
jgi:hypothetical protein